MTQTRRSTKFRKSISVWLALAVFFVLVGIAAVFLSRTVKDKDKEEIDKISVDTFFPSQPVAGFPSELVYPEASYVYSEIGEEESYSAELNTDESVSTVASWYGAALTQQGWKIDFSSWDPNNNDVQTIRATKGAKSFIVSAIRNPDNKTKIVLSQWKQIPDDVSEEHQ